MTTFTQQALEAIAENGTTDRRDSRKLAEALLEQLRGRSNGHAAPADSHVDVPVTDQTLDEILTTCTSSHSRAMAFELLERRQKDREAVRAQQAASDPLNRGGVWLNGQHTGPIQLDGIVVNGPAIGNNGQQPAPQAPTADYPTGFRVELLPLDPLVALTCIRGVVKNGWKVAHVLLLSRETICCVFRRLNPDSKEAALEKFQQIVQGVEAA